MQTSESNLHDMPKWVRRYAQNQTLPVLVSLAIFGFVFAAIGGFSYLAGQAYRAGQRPQFVMFLAALVASVAANIWLSIPRWGGRSIAGLGQRICAEEGRVQLGSPKPTTAVRIVVLGFGLFMLAFIGAAIAGFVNERYLQPVSALCFVPFVTFLILIQRPASGYLMLLWPALYMVHAILILAGVPILFEGRWDALNMLIPTLGYGLLAASVAYLYSRYAFYRLKRLARQPLPAGGHGLD